MMENHLMPNRQYKDRLFRFLFQEKQDLLNLYNAVNNSSYDNPDELELRTLDNVLYMSMRNDVAFLIDNRMNLYEEQSSWNPNMPLRGLFYFSKLYSGYVAEHNLDIYSYRKLKLPFPQYVVFYIGDDHKFERETLRLSDSFNLQNANLPPCLECTADIINISVGHNEQLISSCRKLYEYSTFVGKIQDYLSHGIILTAAIQKAIDTCIEQGILADFLKRYRGEVTNMILSEYNEEFHLKCLREEAREIGYEEGLEAGRKAGLEAGIESGRQKATDTINLLTLKLLEQNRTEDLKKAASDPKYQLQLLREFHLIE